MDCPSYLLLPSTQLNEDAFPHTRTSHQPPCLPFSVHGLAITLSLLPSPTQDMALAIALANSLRDQTRMEGELAELRQVRGCMQRGSLHHAPFKIIGDFRLYGLIPWSLLSHRYTA